MDDLLAHQRFRNVTEADILRIVENCEKKRFHIEKKEDGLFYVRANQGHSMRAIEVEMTEITIEKNLVDQCIHGTYYKAWDLIKTQGLSKMNRQHVHFSEDFPGSKQVISGMRKNCQIAIYVDLNKALKDGVKFYKSANNVILSPGNQSGFIEPKYFSKVLDLAQSKASIFFSFFSY